VTAGSLLIYQWHREGFDLLRGATLLAMGQNFEGQAFRYRDKAYGFQFHPGMTFATLCRWTVFTRKCVNGPGACPVIAISKGGFGTPPPWRAGPALFCAAGLPAGGLAHAPAGRTRRIGKGAP
jgi:GMP synthase (glutamine-hydrolysing)